MPDEIEFVMPFPCYLPLTKQSVPELIEIDGNLCLAIFTKTKNVERFSRAKHASEKGFRSVPMYTFETAAALHDFLIANEAPFEEQKCNHLAIDPQPSTPPMYAPIRDFVEYLKTVG